jgi:hypothetical protein
MHHWNIYRTKTLLWNSALKMELLWSILMSDTRSDEEIVMAAVE